MLNNLAKNESPTRPVLRYHGGKWLLGKWIISHFPEHTIYTEAFCGAASVFFQKPKSSAEILNDKSGDIVNLFSVLRDPLSAAELARRISLTPFAYDEYKAARLPADDPIERARQMIVCSYMSVGTDATTRKGGSGFRSYSRVDMIGKIPAQQWPGMPEVIRAAAERLSGVIVENRDAVQVLKQHDTEATLHYIDPPYPHSTRGASRGQYKFEMSDDQHRDLSAVLHELKGMVALSGYACELYDKELYGKWFRVTCDSLADSARPRTEVLWLNDSAREHLNAERAQSSLTFA